MCGGRRAGASGVAQHRSRCGQLGAGILLKWASMSVIGGVTGLVSPLRRGLHRFRGLLSATEWTYLLSLLVPAFVFDLSLSIIRVAYQYGRPGPLGIADELRPDLLVHLGFLLCWTALFAVLRRSWPRAIVIAAFHVGVVTYLLFSTCAHFYYLKTGSLLDANQLAAAYQSFDEIQGLLGTELSPLYWTMFSIIIGYGFIGPAIITRTLHGWWLPGRFDTSAGTRPLRARTAAAAAVTAAALVLLSALPGFTSAGAFARNRAVDVAADAIESGLGSNSGDVVVRRGQRNPTGTYLAKTNVTKKRNVVMIVMESVRAESTSVYNPEMKTTPFLAELARNSLVADNAYAVLPHTSKSLTAAHCGIEPPLDTKMTESEPDALPAKCLPRLLKEQGYRTAFFQSAVGEFERRNDLLENFGYDNFFPVNVLPKAGYHRANYFGYEDDIMLDPSRKWVQKNSASPFLLTYLTVTSHHDYQVPVGFAAEHLSDDPVINDYLNTIRYTDRFVQQVIEQFKKMGLYDDTIFVVMADHGEGFGEHGLYQHDNTIYNEGIKIPLIVHDPKRFRGGQHLQTPVQNTSVLPTIADLLGYRLTGGTYHAASLLQVHPAPLRVSCFMENRCLAYIEGDKKYVHHFGIRPDEVFDLSADPGETHNIISQQDKAQVKSWRQDLLRWRDQVSSAYALQRSAH